MLIEHETVSKLCELCGFAQGDGIFTPGMSMLAETDLVNAKAVLLIVMSIVTWFQVEV